MKKYILIMAILGLFQFSYGQESTTKIELPATTENTSVTAPDSNSAISTTAQTTTSDSQIAPANSASSVKTKLKDALKNKKFQEATEITDAKLKAEGGSLSKYSLKFNLGYSGPPTTDLDSSYQPSPDTNKKPSKVNLSGSISGKYRIDSEKSFAAGTGLRANDPMHGVPTYDTIDPFFALSVLSRTDGMQMSHYFKVSSVTNPLYTSVGEDGSVSYDNWLVYDLGTSKFALEFDTNFGYYFYNRGPNLTPSKYLKYEKTANRYSVSVIPILKYRLSGKLNLETSVSFTYTNYRTTDDLTLWNQSMSTQRVGIGYAITRDIYINPYISFYPSQFSPEYTSMNFSTTFSLL
jgi:hypothetical protein